MAAATGTLLVFGCGDWFTALSYLVVWAGPAMAINHFAWLSRETPEGETEWYPPGALLAWLMGAGLLTFTIVLVIAAQSAGGLEKLVHDYLVQAFLKVNSSTGADTVNEPDLLAGRMAAVLPAAIIDGWLIYLVFKHPWCAGLGQT